MWAGVYWVYPSQRLGHAPGSHADPAVQAVRFKAAAELRPIRRTPRRKRRRAYLSWSAASAATRPTRSRTATRRSVTPKRSRTRTSRPSGKTSRLISQHGRAHHALQHDQRLLLDRELSARRTDSAVAADCHLPRRHRLGQRMKRFFQGLVAALSIAASLVAAPRLAHAEDPELNPYECLGRYEAATVTAPSRRSSKRSRSACPSSTTRTSPRASTP